MCNLVRILLFQKKMHHCTPLHSWTLKIRYIGFLYWVFLYNFSNKKKVHRCKIQYTILDSSPNLSDQIFDFGSNHMIYQINFWWSSLGGFQKWPTSTKTKGYLLPLVSKIWDPQNVQLAVKVFKNRVFFLRKCSFSRGTTSKTTFFKKKRNFWKPSL